MAIPFVLLLIAVSLSVTGELLLKYGMNKVGLLSFNAEVFLPTLWRAFSTPHVIAGFASIFLGSIFWLSVISRLPLSYAYPMLSVSYILVVIASWLLLGEQLTVNRVLGVFIICTGVVVVFRS